MGKGKSPSTWGRHLVGAGRLLSSFLRALPHLAFPFRLLPIAHTRVRDLSPLCPSAFILSSSCTTPTTNPLLRLNRSASSTYYDISSSQSQYKTYHCIMLFFAGQASQRIAATESLTTGQDGGLNSPCAVMQGNNEAATAGSQTYNGDSASDSGFFETSDSATPRIDYKDFQLFHDDLPAIDPDIDRFFADADASCQSQDITFHTEVNGSGVGLGNRAPGSNLPAVEDDFFHAINQVDVTAVSATGHEARKDCEIRPQSTDISAPPTPSHPGDVTIDPLRLWIGTYLRHEHIAYQLLQQPQKPLATSHPIPDRRPA